LNKERWFLWRTIHAGVEILQGSGWVMWPIHLAFGWIANRPKHGQLLALVSHMVYNALVAMQLQTLHNSSLTHFVNMGSILYNIMTKSKNTSNQRRSTNPRRNPPKRQALGELDKFITANVQPFHPQAVGAKSPDSNMLPSVPVTLRMFKDISIDANGHGAVIFRPYIDETIIDPVSISAGLVVTWDTAGALTATDMDSAPSSADWVGVKTVGGGVRMQYESKQDEATGHVCVAQGPDGNSTAELSYTSWPADENEARKATWSHNITLSQLADEPVTMPFLMVDSNALDYRFIGPSRTVTQIDNGTIPFTGWSYIAVFIDAGQPNAVVNFEVILHLELLPRLSNQDFLLSPTPAKIHKPETIGIVQKIHLSGPQGGVIHSGNDHDTHVREALSDLKDTAVSIGQGLIVRGIRAVASKIGPLVEETLPFLTGLFL